MYILCAYAHLCLCACIRVYASVVLLAAGMAGGSGQVSPTLTGPIF